MNEENNVIFDFEDKRLIIEHLYTVEDYSTLNIKVKSGEFAGAANFCIPKDKVNSILNTLSNMRKELRGYCEINDSDSDGFIMVEMGEMGHIYMYGQIGGSHEEHFMKFRYTTDQTILDGLVQMLKTLL